MFGTVFIGETNIIVDCVALLNYKLFLPFRIKIIYFIYYLIFHLWMSHIPKGTITFTNFVHNRLCLIQFMS